eukprot:TRINITY_DN4_c0_g1_i8.p2 TRINITY_DN4_c0_g1~~TRINITY_DN4_c0_g1_i8.p2  ORF type:complete len:175 (+),score=68.30 TRINITY_DN4_c0_g1_i8:490-1014(+)
MNAGSNLSKEPVENVFWPVGGAPLGKYKVIVHNYSERNTGKTPFKVSIKQGDETKLLTGEIGGTGQRIELITFDWQGKKASNAKATDYSAYNTDTILAAWRQVLPPTHIVTFSTAKAVVDILLGIIALHQGTRTVETYMADMKEKGQDEARCSLVRACLTKIILNEAMPSKYGV